MQSVYSCGLHGLVTVVRLSKHVFMRSFDYLLTDRQACLLCTYLPTYVCK